MTRQRSKQTDLDEELIAYVTQHNTLRDLTGRAIQKGVRESVWDQVEWTGEKCVLDLGPGNGYHFQSLMPSEKKQVIALEKDPTMIHMLRQNHPEVNIVEGEWTDLEAALGDDLQVVKTVTGFNIMQYIKPEVLAGLQEQIM